MNLIPVLVNEATAAKRRVYFFLRLAADGVSPASKSGGQPQISIDGGAWTDTGIGTLTEVGNGEHYADVTQGSVSPAGRRIRTRFADEDTLEERGDTLAVVAFDMGSAPAARLALSAGTMIPGTVDTAGFSATATEFEADDIAEATPDHYNGRVILFTSGALLGQATSISDYVLTGGRGHFTIVALTEPPTDDSTFIIV